MSRCTATAKSTGERCQKDAIKGGTVCHLHGGSAPQVKAKAQERLDRMADEVTADVAEILSDLKAMYDEADDDEKLAIQGAIQSHWRIILDRTGHGPTEKRQLTGNDGGPIELTLNEEVVETPYSEANSDS